MVINALIVNQILVYMKVIDETLIFRCFNCKKNYKKEINKELIERLAIPINFAITILINLLCC